MHVTATGSSSLTIAVHRSMVGVFLHDYFMRFPNNTVVWWPLSGKPRKTRPYVPIGTPTSARNNRMRRRTCPWAGAGAVLALSFWAVVVCLPGRTQELAPLGPLAADHRVTFFVAEGAPGSAFRTGDRDLALWALHAWEREARGAFTFVPVQREEDALVRVYWAPPGGGQYGEMVPIDVRGKRGAAVFVRPETNAFGPEIASR